MTIQVFDNGHSAHRDILYRISGGYELFPVSVSRIELDVKQGIGPSESFLLKRHRETIWITGSDKLGLYYGIGKLVHNIWRIDDQSLWNTVVSPKGSFRAIYWCAHFYNWFAMAPEEEQAQYLEELLLWGYNTVVSGVGIVNCETENDPVFKRDADKCRKIFLIAKKL